MYLSDQPVSLGSEVGDLFDGDIGLRGSALAPEDSLDDQLGYTPVVSSIPSSAASLSPSLAQQ